MTSMATAKRIEITARIRWTTRKPTECTWSTAMLRTRTAHTHNVQSAAILSTHTAVRPTRAP